MQILEQIFKFLPINELLSTRLVCRTWKSESDRKLKLRQTLIVLRTKKDIQRITDLMDKRKVAGSTTLFNKFLIWFDQMHLEQAPVRNFLNRHGAAVEQLSLKFSCNLLQTHNTPQSFKYLLEQQVPNLKSLQFFGFSEQLWQSGELFNDSQNLLPKLEHIGCITVTEYRHAWECPLYLSLFSRLSNVKKLTINCSNYWNILFSHAVSNNENPLRNFFSEVEEIGMEFGKRSLLLKIQSHEDCLPINNSNILKLLPQVCPKVRILRFCFDTDNITNGDVSNLLKQYAPQLEELWINVSDLHHDVDADEDQANRPNEEGSANSGALTNEFFSTSVFRQLRVIRTGIDLFKPSSTVNQLFRKQLPMLQFLSLNCKPPALQRNHDFQHSGLHTLELLYWNAECLVLADKFFPNTKILRVTINGDADLQLITNAFPNLEELNVSSTSKLTNDGIRCIGDLNRNYFIFYFLT